MTIKRKVRRFIVYTLMDGRTVKVPVIETKRVEVAA